MSREKSVKIKIFNRLGVFQGEIDNSKLLSFPVWSEEINLGFSTMSLNLGYKFDEIPSYIQDKNIIEIYVISKNYPLGKLKYRGEVSNIETPANLTDESVIVHVFPDSGLTGRSPYKDGTNYTINISGDDPADVMKDIFDDIKGDYSGRLDYKADSVDDVGVSIAMDIENQLWKDAIDKVFEVVDANWYYRYSPEVISGVANTYFYMKEFGTEPDYTFWIDRDVSELSPISESGEIVNQQTVIYNGGSVTVQNSGSITNYGLHEPPPITDTNINDLTTANQKANHIINNKKDPRLSGSVIIFSDKLDVDDLHVGQTCKIKGHKQSTSLIQGELLKITKIDYNYETVKISFGELEDSMHRWLDKFLQYRLNRFL